MPPFGKRAEGKQIDASCLTRMRSANGGHDEITHGEIAHASADGFNSR